MWGISRVVTDLLDSQEGLCSTEFQRSINPNISIVYRRAIVISVCRALLITLPTNLNNFDNLSQTFMST